MKSTAYQHLRQTVLRGGHLTKFKGQVMSISPQIGAILDDGAIARASTAWTGLTTRLGSAVRSTTSSLASQTSIGALSVAITSAAMTMSPSAAQAACLATSPGVFVCDNATSSTQTIFKSNNADNLSVTLLPNFSIETESGNALYILNQYGGDIAVVQNPDGGDINAAMSGMRVVNINSGENSKTEITTTGSVIAGSIGIDANSASTTLDINSASVQGGEIGISAEHFGGGALSITTAGVITGGSGAGIKAFTSPSGAGDLNITTRDEVTGGTNGIVTNKGTIAVNNVSLGATTITAENTITGFLSSGIDAKHYGSLGLTITVGEVRGGLSNDDIVFLSSADGITAYNGSRNAGSSLVITQSADKTIEGHNNGIFATNRSGMLTINTSGTVISRNGSGIKAELTSQSTGAYITAHHVTGTASGINAYNRTYGQINITTTGTVIATTNTGIGVGNRSTSAGINIDTFGLVTGGGVGIGVQNRGTGDTVINAEAAVYGGREIGVFATNYGSGDLNITTMDMVSGGKDGIYGRHYGTGDLNIVSTTGVVSGKTREGIRIKSEARNISLSAHTVNGGTNGVYVSNKGTGSTSITTTSVTGARNGINARNYGNASLTITTTIDGFSYGKNGDGIHALNGRPETGQTIIDFYSESNYFITPAVLPNGPLTITTNGAVTGGDDGIEARNYGTAGLTITANADVTGKGGMGIRAFNSANDTTASMLITQAAGTTTTGGIHGILADNAGGSLKINALGTSIGETESGIYAVNQASATDLTITSFVARGAQNGIYATNKGAGDTSITTTDIITGTNNDGIYAVNEYRKFGDNPGDLIITTNDVTGGVNGIKARNERDGIMAINSVGSIEGKTGDGVNVRRDVRGGDVTVNVNNVLGANDGINAYSLGQYGAGLRINAEGDVFGNDGDGIYANSSFATSDLIITAVNVSGAENGIFATHSGDGDLSITTSGTVTGRIAPSNDSSNQGGIVALQFGVGDLRINVNDVLGAGNGIYASTSSESGALVITSSGSITGTAYHGIVAEHNGVGDLAIDVVDVQGGIYGIVALNEGSGNTSIITRGQVVGVGPGRPDNSNVVGGRFQDEGADGIRARNEDTGNMSITIAEGSSIEGFLDGIRADNQRNIGRYFYGVPFDQTGDMVINVLGSVSGGRDGIRVGQQANGAFSVTISGSVSGGENGLHNSYIEYYERNPTYTRGGTFIITETGSLTGGLGKYSTAFRDSARTLEFTNNDPSSDLLIYGALNGDVVMGEGSDTITISGPNATLGAMGARRGSVVTFNGDGDGITPYNESAYNYRTYDYINQVSNKYFFKEQDYITGQTDRLTFSNWSGSDQAARDDVTITDIDGSQILNIEEVFLTDAADVTFADEIAPGWGMSNLSGNGLLLQVEDGSIAGFAGDFTVFGNVNNFGALDLSTPNLAVGTVLTITGDYAAASDLFLDVILNDGGADNVPANDAVFADQVFVAGDVSGVTHVFVNNIGGTGALTDLNRNGAVDGNEGILIVQVGGTTPLDTNDSSGALANHFILGSASNTFRSASTGRINASVGAVSYDIYAIGENAVGNINGTTDYVLANVGFSPVAPVYEAYPSFLLDQIGLPRLQERVGNRHWAQQPATAAVMQELVYVFCKDPVQNFRCAVTPEQAQVYADPLFGSVVANSAAVIEGQGLWARADGMRSRYTPDGSTTGAQYRARAAGVQIGYDHLLAETETGGRLIGGVNLSYRTSRADVTSISGLGEIATEGYGLGASLTWYGQNGFYIDGQAQAVWLESDLSADGLARYAAGHKTEGYGLSVEVGKEIALSDTWAITPQTQLSYANVKANGFTDELGSTVAFNAESLQLRLGAELSNEKTWMAKDGTTSRRSVRAGVHMVREFKPETMIVVAGTPLRSKRDATTAEITLGGTYNWSDDRNSIYGQVAASTGLDNFGDSHRVRGTVGFRRQWE